jgi:hypothetical protein
MPWKEIFAPEDRARVQRNGQSAWLIVPDSIEVGPYVTPLTDGNGRLGFRSGDKGRYKVGTPGGSGSYASRRITIPSEFKDKFPKGTTPAKVTEEGDILVLDLSQFAEAS